MKTIDKNIYQFTLILKNVTDETPNLEDSLYNAGCSDALINFRNGTVYLDFDRTAHSFEEAIITAIHEIESSSIGAVVANVAPESLVTESDIAKRLALKRQTVSLWINGLRRKFKTFPNPVMKLSDRSPLWKWSEVIKWLYQNNIIDNKAMIKQAEFLENINAALEDRYTKARKKRQELLKKINDIKPPRHTPTKYNHPLKKAN